MSSSNLAEYAGTKAETVYFDEEECLGLDVFVTELELVVGSTRGRGGPDQSQLLELLPKLAATIPKTEKAVLKVFQKKCEGVFTELINTGVCSTVRKLICCCLTKLYAYGDTMPIYARVNYLQSTLSGKDYNVKPASETVRVGMLDVLAHLSANHGRHVSAAAAESMSIASRVLASKSASGQARLGGLRLAAAVVEGLNPYDRTAAWVHAEAWNIFHKYIREKTTDDLRIATVGVLSAIAHGGGTALWREGGFYFEEALRLCILGLEEPNQAARDAYGMALCDLALAVRHDALAAALKEETRPNKRVMLQRVTQEGIAARACMVQPLIDSAIHGQREICTTLAVAWTHYIHGVQASSGGNNEVLVDLAVQVVQMCDSTSKALQEAREKGVISPDMDLGGALAGGEIPHIQACALYVLRVGIIEALTEANQRKLLERLTHLLKQTATTVPAAVVALEGMSILLDILGEIGEDMGGRVIEDVILSQVVSLSGPVRSQAAQAAAALAAAQPSSAARMLSEMLENLEGLAQQLGGQMPLSNGISGPKSEAALMAGAHGSVLASAAVLLVSSRLPLALPTRISQHAYQLAARLITNPFSETAAPRALEREAGYILLGALVTGGHPDVLTDHREGVLDLLETALGQAAKQELDEHKYMRPGGDTQLAMELWWRSVALQVLTAYINNVLAKGLVADVSGQIDRIAEMLAPVLEVMAFQQCMHEPARAKGGPGGLLAACAGTFQVRLLEAYRLVPIVRMAPVTQSTLLTLCIKPLKDGVVIPPGHAEALYRTALRACLSREDGALGPWLPGRNPAEDELQAFSGERGGPHQQPWEGPLLASLFSRFPDETAGSGAGQASGVAAAASSGSDFAMGSARARGPLYPQPLGLAPCLVAVQLAMLGKLLATMSNGVQLQILEVLMQYVASFRVTRNEGLRKERETTARRTAASVVAGASSLAGLIPLARTSKGSDSSDKVADKILQLANTILDDGGARDQGLARCAAQLMAASACLGSEGWAVKLVRAVCAELTASVADGRDPDRRCGLSLAVGCIHRAKGGMALQSVVGVSVDALMTVARRPAAGTGVWALHALSLVAGSAGLTYLSSVKGTLQLCQDLLTSGYDAPGLQAGCAQLANAMVAVLGPEFTLGSVYYRKAKSLIYDLGMASDDAATAFAAVTGSAAGGTPVNGDGTAHGAAAGQAHIDTGAPKAVSSEDLQSQLQSVLFAQQLILFAPDRVQATKHIPMLQATLLSKRPALRRAAANTLRHLAERDPHLLLPERIEPALVASLDGETNGIIAGQLRATLKTLLVAGCREEPSYWLALLSEVVFSTGGASSQSQESSGVDDRSADHGDHDRDTTTPSTRAGSAGGASVKGAGCAGGVAAGLQTASSTGGTPRASAATEIALAGIKALLATTALRLRTRLFAADLLLKMCRELAGSSSFVDAAAPSITEGESEAGSGEDLLIHHVQELVDTGFKLATGQTEALRPTGVRLLEQLVHMFAAVEDPLLPGARLLEQYQAQLVSALRIALQPHAAPTLSIVGGSLATCFLESGLAGGDAKVMKRLMELLTTPLLQWTSLSFEQYAEWVGVRSRVELLRAHAQCAVLDRHGGDELAASIVSKAQAPYKPMLLSLWAALLQDHAVLATQHPTVQRQYTSVLLGSHPVAPAAGPVIRRVYSAACLNVLEAATVHLIPAGEIAVSKEAIVSGAPLGRMRDMQTGIVLTAPWYQYCSLLDVALLLLTDTSGKLASQLQGQQGIEDGTLSSGVEIVAGAGQALQRLLGGEYMAFGLASPSAVVDVVNALVALCQGMLTPILWSLTKGGQTGWITHLVTITSIVADLLKGLVIALPSQHLMENASLGPAIVEALLAATSITNPFSTEAQAAPVPRERPTPQQLEQVQEQQPGQEQEQEPKQGDEVQQQEDAEGQADVVAAHTGRVHTVALFLPDKQQQSMDQALVGLLIAGQALLRKGLPGVVDRAVTPLLRLANRLLHTAQPGMQLTAARRFFESCMAIAMQHATQTSVASNGNMGQEAGSRSEQVSKLAARAVLSVVDSLQQQLAALAVTSSFAAEDGDEGDEYGSFESSPKGPAEPSASAAGRLPALISAAAVGPAYLTGDVATANAVSRQVLDLLSGLLQPSSSCGRSTQLAVLDSMTGLLQEGAAEQPPVAKGTWALRILTTVGPLVAGLAHTLMSPVPAPAMAAGLMPEEDVAVVSAALKVLLAAAGVAAASRGAEAQQAVMKVLVPLLVEAAAPPAGCPSAPGLRDLAIKLVMSLPSTAAGDAFKYVVAALPAEAKQRLQTALREVVAGTATPAEASAADTPADSVITPAIAATGQGRPAISLKTSFAIPSRS